MTCTVIRKMFLDQLLIEIKHLYKSMINEKALLEIKKIVRELLCKKSNCTFASYQVEKSNLIFNQ